MFCTNCGHPIGDDQRHCPTCGALRQAPAAPPTPPPLPGQPAPGQTTPGQPAPWPPAPPDPTRVQPAQPWPPMGAGPEGPGGPVTAPAPPAPTKAGRGKLALVLILVGVLALGGIAFAVVKALGGDSGGAKDPEAAVTALATAVDAEDPVAALATMNPDEVRTLGRLYTDAARRAKALGYAPKGKTLGGIDLATRGLRYRVEELGPKVAKVTVTGGELRYDVSRSELGRRVDALVTRTSTLDDDPSDPVDKPAATNQGVVTVDDLRHRTDGSGPERDPFVMVVKREGGWYVSPVATAAQYTVELAGLPSGTFDDPDAGKATADSPEAAADAFARALAELDTDKAMDQLAGSELLSLRAYRKALARFVADRFDAGEVKDPTADIADIAFTTRELGDDQAEVTLASARGTARWTDQDGDQKADFTWDSTCLSTTGQGSDENKDCITADTRRFGLTKAFVVAVKEDGGWRISPVATAERYAEQVLPKLDANLISRLFGVEDTADVAGTAKLGAPLKATLNEAGFAVYDLAVTKDKPFTITAGDVSGGGSSFVYLVDAGGRSVSSSDRIEPTSGGTWKLVVERDHLGKGSVALTLDPVLERPLTIDEPVVGALNSGGQIVEYLLDASGDEQVTVDFVPGGGDGIGDGKDLTAVLLDPDGDTVKPDDGDTYTLDRAGEYRVRVTGIDGGTGKYRLTVANATDFVLGDGSTDVATGTLDTPDSVLTIDLEVRGGATVVATASSDDPALDLVVVVVDPDGTETPYDGAPAGGSEGVRFFPEVTTTYELRVTAAGGATGSVNVEATTE